MFGLVALIAVKREKIFFSFVVVEALAILKFMEFTAFIALMLPCCEEEFQSRFSYNM